MVGELQLHAIGEVVRLQAHGDRRARVDGHLIGALAEREAVVLEVGFEGGDILLGIEAEEEGLGRHEARAEGDVERVLDEGHGLILGEEAVD